MSTAKQVGQTLNTQRILVVGPGNFLGLEDLARLKPHSYSVRCVSTTGVIILLEPEKFNSIVKHIPDGFKEITRINKLKWKSYYDTLARLEDQKHEMIGRQKQLINESSDTFTNMEFFKATYFNERLDRQKMRRIFEQKVKTAADLREL